MDKIKKQNYDDESARLPLLLLLLLLLPG
jgi:hypothetical protein